jgi:hypothetical protein
MNEGDVSIESTTKKKRRSRFRYSSKKALDRSKVKRRTAKVLGIQIESVTRALSYPSESGYIVLHDNAARSSFPPCVDCVEEHDGDEMELSCGNAITYDSCNIKVSIMPFLMFN